MGLKCFPEIVLIGISPKEKEIFGTDVLFTLILRLKELEMAQMFGRWYC